MGFSYFHAYATSEQMVVRSVSNFLSQIVGWTVFDVITDTASDLDVVLSSPGEDDVDNSNTIFIRLRGTSDDVRLFTYETYESIGVNTGENTDATYGNITCIGTVDITCIADLERVIIALEEDGGNRYFGYVGRIDAYVEWPEHPYPLLVKGMQNVAYDFFYTANPRNMWMIRSDGTAGSPYFPARGDADTTLDASAISARNGETVGFKIPVRYSDDPAYSEVAGELRGVYTVPADQYVHDSFLKLSGDTYVVIQGNGTYSWACGPIAENGVIPPPLPLGLNTRVSPPV